MSEKSAPAWRTRFRHLHARIPRDRRDSLLLALTALLVLGALAATTAQNGQLQWNYLAGLAITMALYAIFALGLSLEFGHTGLLNFGHVGFMAIGAYSYGILMMRPQDRPADAPGIVGAFYDMAPHLENATLAGAAATATIALLAGAIAALPLALLAGRLPWGTPRQRLVAALGLSALAAIATFAALFPLTPESALGTATLLSMLTGILLAAFAGLLLGLPTLRLREDYLAIVTIGAAEILRSILLNEEHVTRGSRQIINFPRPLIDWSLETGWWRDIATAANVRPATLAILVTALIALALVLLLLEALAKSPWGRIVRAIREDEDAAASLGKDPFKTKLQALMLGSGIAALSGILLITYLANIAPTHFLPIITFYAFIIVILGGQGNHKGAIAGAIVLWGLFSIVQTVPSLQKIGLTAGPPQTVLIGLLLILIMMKRPQGLLGNKQELAHAK